MFKRTTRSSLFSSTIITRAALSLALGVPTVAALSMPSIASAQDYSTGALVGAVRDAAGNPVNGASVEIQSTSQGFTRRATTSASGDFRSALLPVGTYVVTITAPGYATLAQSVSIQIGGTASYNFTLASGSSSDATSVDEIVVTAATRTLDRNRTTTGLTVDLEELVKTVPVGRDITSVVLLAPTTNAGDSAFGNQPSVAGSSVAENAFYLNGMNITNFDNYIGGTTVPFEFYRSVEVMTGGYSAEYGRSTGGIVNAVSKSGTNEFKFGLSGNWTPNSLRETSPNTYSTANDKRESESQNYIIQAGGPIIKDRLFFYGLVELRDTESSSYSITGNSNTRDRSDDPFYGLKLDANITDNHRLEGTYLNTFRQTDRTVYGWDSGTDTLGNEIGKTLFEQGGESWVARYTGSLTDWLTISAAYGSNRETNTSVPSTSDLNYAQDSRFSPARRVSPNQAANSFTPTRSTERIFYRADADIYFSLRGEHHLRFGYDREETELTRFTRRTGGFAYIYRRASAGTAQAIGGNLAPGQDFVEVNVYDSGGNFTGENEAFYITDSWRFNDALTLNLGVRLDKFLVNNNDGVPVASFDKEIAPRLGFIYEPFQDGNTRVYGSYGRYYLPIASNTAYRMGASELYHREYFLLEGYNQAAGEVPYDTATGAPIRLGNQIVGWNSNTACPERSVFAAPGSRGCTVTGDGKAMSADALVARNFESTAQDEFIIGVEHRFGDNWTFNVGYTYRDLIRNAEDVAIDAAVLKYCEREGISGCEDIWSGFHQYVLVNPGKNSTIILSDPINGEATPREVNFSAQDLGYPEASRTYQALELSLRRDFDGVWGARGSWVISSSKGNTEGYVKSDNGQDDAGITQDFDQPGLVDGAYGPTPNHRAHVFKLFGQYQLTQNLLLGSNINVSSPRKFGCLGYHPTDDFAYAYGAASFYCNGQLTPRGSQMESDWTTQIDMSLRYTVPLTQMPGNLVLRADIFNILNAKGVTDLYEVGEISGVGDIDKNYGSAISYQTPRYIRLGFDWQF